MTDVSWTIGLSTGDVTGDRLKGGSRSAGPWPSVTPGETETVTFGWDLSNGSTFKTVRDFGRLGARPGAAATPTGLDTTPFYRELHGDSKDLLASFEPTGAGLSTYVDGWWGVIVGYDDVRNNVDTNLGLKLQTYVLAELSAYNTRAAAEDVHER